MKNKLTVLALLILSFTSISFAQITINGSGSYLTIQSAINVSFSGDVINVPDGIYNEALNVTVPNLSIIGNIGSPSSVVINAGGLTGFGSPLSGIYVNQPGVILKGFTLNGDGQATVTNPRYGINISGVTGGTVQYVVIQNFSRTGLNVPSCTNMTFDNITAVDNGGQGLGLRDVSSSTLSNITTNNNLWGGVRIQTYNGTVSGLVISGTNSFGENGSAPLYLHPLLIEQGNSSISGPPFPITYGTSGTPDLLLQSTDFAYALSGDDDEAPQYQRIHVYKTLANVMAASQAPNGTYAFHITDHRFVTNLSNSHFEVFTPLTISNAVLAASSGNYIDVAAGTYNETVTIDKPLTITGTGSPTVTQFIYAASPITVTGFSGGSTATVDVQPGADIDDVMDLVSSGGTINIDPGTYSSFVVDKPVTIDGNGNVIITNSSPAITVNVTGVHITGLTFSFNDNILPYDDYAIDVQNGAYDLLIDDCNFQNQLNGGNGNGVINRGTGIVDARNNYWNDPTGPTFSLNPSGLGRIATNSNSGSLLFSPWWTDLAHTTKAGVATQTSPANTLTGVPILPTFTWDGTTVANTTYSIEISTSNTFPVLSTTTIVVGVDLYTATLTEINKLLNNTTYYWRVKSDVNAVTTYSLTWSFKTIPVVSVSPINPINGSTGVYFDPTYFSFQIVNGFTGSLKYLVQYRVSAAVPTIAEWAGSNTFTLTNLLSELPYPLTLLANSKYYWRVVVLNSTDEVVSYSGNYYFTTKSGAPTPYLSYPIGGQPVATNSPSFYWYIGTYDLTNITFDLEIAIDAAFTLNHQTVTGITDIQYAWGLAPLTPGTTYYWRVTTWYKKGNVLEQHSATSSYSTFKAMGTGTASTPYLSYPVGGLSIYTTTPTLYWYTGASTDGVVFDVYIKLSSSGIYTQIADNTSNLYFDMSGPLLNPFTLAAGSTYNWYVVATGGNGPFTSGISSFVVNSSVGTGSVIASWPVGNPYVYSLTPSLYWYMYGSQTGLTKYVIKYKQMNSAPADWDVEAGTTTQDPISLVSTSFDIPSNLTSGAKYYWAIAGYNGGVRVTSWSEGSFTVSSTTTTVSVYLSTPVGGATVYTLTPTLYWYATGAISGITSYDITYSNTSNFLGGLPPAFVTTINTGTDNFYTLPSNPAIAGATIYWKVTVNYTGGSTTSTTGSFVIDPGSSNVVPLVGSPINNTELKSSAATLSWFTPAQSKAKLSYTVEYSENSNFANAKIASGLSEPQLNISGLKENTTYYWRAKSVDPQGSSSKFSEVALFRTSGKVTGVEEQEIPAQFELAQNYPNPFNPTTLISYALPQNSFVTLKVYDMLGREIKTLVSKEVAAGSYSVNWNGDDNFGNKVSTGAYVYRITAGDFVSVKKMLLIK
ncbi:MAG: FlgD immunoglobulin-like domain containing protein [Melioribacteraceae bacterium]